MYPLVSPVRTYDWGSRTVIAAIQGRAVPSPEPEAELWIGAHPSAPSVLAGVNDPTVGSGTGGVALDDAIARDPVGMLGPVVATDWGRLPFLLKVLAVAQPLSLQAHPDGELARDGFAAEDAAGVPLGCAARSYVDPHHKPELLVAVEEFDALCGFRAPEASAVVLESFGVPALAPVVAALRSGPVPHRLRAAVRMLMAWPDQDRPGLVAALADTGRSLSAAGAAAVPGDPESARSHALAADLGQRFPGDMGVLVALLLNQVRLRPDEAMFLPPGSLHAYQRGVGVEVMAASDNVLRGGLTSKPVNVPELLRVVRYDVLSDPVVRPRRHRPGVLVWQPPVREFALTKVDVDGGTGPLALPGDGPRLLVCLRGEARLSAGHRRQVIHSGESVFVSPALPVVSVVGDAVVYQASVP